MKDFAYSKYPLNIYCMNEQRFVCSWYFHRVTWNHASDICYLWFYYVCVVKRFMLISEQLIRKNWFFPQNLTAIFFPKNLESEWSYFFAGLMNQIACTLENGVKYNWTTNSGSWSFPTASAHIFHIIQHKWSSFSWSPKKMHLSCIKCSTPQIAEKCSVVFFWLLRSVLIKTCVKHLPTRPRQGENVN